MYQPALPGLSSTPEAFQLRSYQQECVNTVLYAYFYQNRCKGVVEAPCSAGKTRAALDILYELWSIDRRTAALILLPSIILAHQVMTEARKFFPHHEIGLVQAENREYNHRIVVATIDTLANPITRRKLFRAQRFKKFPFVWIDEAHTKCMGTLNDILEDLEEEGALRLGTSATVWRSDDKSLLIPFPDGLYYSIGRDELVEKGHVLPFEIHEVRTTAKDRHEKALWSWSEYTREQQTVIFARSKSDVYGFHRYFKQQGIKSAVILAETPGWKRDVAFGAFKRGEIPILITVRVLTTGVDWPWARAAIIACDAWMKGVTTIGHHQAVGRIARRYDEIGPDGTPVKTAGKLIYLTTEHARRIPPIPSSLGYLPGEVG